MTLPVFAAELAFRTKIARFTSVEKSEVKILRASTSYHLDEDVADLVSVVEGLVRFPNVRVARSGRSRSDKVVDGGDAEFNSCGEKCSETTTPAVLRKAYSIPNEMAAVNNSSRMAVVEFEFQYSDPDDGETFSESCSVSPVVAVDRETGPQSSVGVGQVETQLDIQYIKVSANITRIFSRKKIV